MDRKIASRDEWLDARKALLDEEKAFQAARDRLAERRRELPLVLLEKDYLFAGENGNVSLSDLFGKYGQLIVYHFMFDPDWDEGCKSCSFLSDGFDGVMPHFAARDVALAVVSRAPLENLLTYRSRMGWGFPWVSSHENDFNKDFNVSFAAEDLASGKGTYNYREGGAVIPEMPGLSVFLKGEAGRIYHSYSTYARGLDPLIPTYQMLDLVPKGRDEQDLPFTMQWVRRHDEYED